MFQALVGCVENLEEVRPKMKRSPLKRKTPLRKVSSKAAKDMRRYSLRRKRFLELNPICQWALCFNKSTDVHHVKGRGKNLLAEESWKALCRRCHDWLHRNGRLARKLGWLKT